MATVSTGLTLMNIAPFDDSSSVQRVRMNPLNVTFSLKHRSETTLGADSINDDFGGNDGDDGGDELKVPEYGPHGTHPLQPQPQSVLVTPADETEQKSSTFVH